MDLLFVMANAPVGLMPMPVDGSQAYVGLARIMEHAINELHETFPDFFGAEPKVSNQHKRW